MDTKCKVTCTWDPPNDTPLCVTEYIIHVCNELNVGYANQTTVEISNKFNLSYRSSIYISICNESDIERSHLLITVQGNITTATFAVNKNSSHGFVVVANNHNISNSFSSVKYHLNTFGKYIMSKHFYHYFSTRNCHKVWFVGSCKCYT